MIISQHGIITSRPRPTQYMKDVESTTIFDLDSTISNSYNGSGNVWYNLVPSPADSELQSAYNFTRGDGSTSTTFPTFTGSVGDPAAYWLFDGGDYFKITSGMNTQWLKDFCKTTGYQQVWFSVAIRYVTGAGTRCYFSTRAGPSGAGVTLNFTSAGFPQIVQSGDTTTRTATGTTAASNNQDVVVTWTHNHATNTSNIWINGTNNSTSTTFDTTTTDAQGVAQIGARFTAPALFLSNGFRVYGLSAGVGLLDSTRELAIRTEYAARHGRSYGT